MSRLSSTEPHTARSLNPIAENSYDPTPATFSLRELINSSFGSPKLDLAEAENEAHISQDLVKPLQDNDSRVARMGLPDPVRVRSVWNGIVTGVSTDDGSFSATIENEESRMQADFRVSEVAPDELGLVRVGSPFYVTVGELSIQRWRPPSTVREIRFRRLPAPGEHRRLQARERARQFLEELNDDAEA
jgi:hypothetical protein